MHDDDGVRTVPLELGHLLEYSFYTCGHAGTVFIPPGGRIIDGLGGGTWKCLLDEVDEHLGCAESRRSGRLSGTEDVHCRASSGSCLK